MLCKRNNKPVVLRQWFRAERSTTTAIGTLRLRGRLPKPEKVTHSTTFHRFLPRKRSVPIATSVQEAGWY